MVQSLGRATQRVSPGPAGREPSPRSEDPARPANRRIGETATRSVLSFSCEPGCNLMTATQEFLAAFTGSRFRAAVAQRVTLASCELLENAISYGSVSGDVLYELRMGQRLVEVAVSNDAIPARIGMLREQLRKIEHNAQEAYLDGLRRSTAGGVARSLLGLARVRWEAEMDIELSIDASRVTLVARCRD